MEPTKILDPMEMAHQFRDDYPHLRKMYNESDMGPAPDPENDKSPEILPNGLEFVHRNHWGAFRPEEMEGFHYLTYPVKKVRLTHTGAWACEDLRTCKIRVARIQVNHMYHHGLQDIAFNFLIGPDGRVYEGRGWDMAPQRDEKLDHLGLGDNCLEIAFIGRHKWEPPPPLMLRTCQSFLKFAVELEYIDKDYELIARYPHLAGSGENVIEEESLQDILAAEKRREEERRAKIPREPPDYYSNFT